MVITLPWVLLQYKDGLLSYGDFHYKDKTVVKPFDLYNENPYTVKTISYKYLYNIYIN